MVDGERGFCQETRTPVIFLLFSHLQTLPSLYPPLCFSSTYNLIDSILPPSRVHCSQLLNVGPLTDHGLIWTYLSSPLLRM